MNEDILNTSNRHVGEVRSINRELFEKALRMRCLAYLSQVKARLLTATIMEIDQSKKALQRSHDEISLQHEAIHKQKAELELKNSELEEIRRALEDRVKERTAQLEQANEQLKLDIARRKQAEVEKDKIQAQLFHAQKMEAVGVLAGGVAHDFNNLLTSILGHCDLLDTGLADSPEQKGDLDQIRNAAARAASLTKQLLAFSRKQMFQPAWLDINAVVSDMAKMLKRLIGEDVELSIALHDGTENIKADKGQIEQILMNLVINARDAMQEGGKIVIKTEAVTLTDEDCRLVTYARPGDFIRLSVEDTGCGMDRETVQSIFEPFFTTKGVGEGTGLGLAVVYGIVKQHEGWINVYSEPGKGTTFRIYLPAFQVSAERKEREKIDINSFQGRGERILLVEDEEGLSQFAIKALTQNGYTVFHASTVHEALELFRKENGQFDLLLSDVILPDQTGIELAEEITSRASLPVLMSSGYTREKSRDIYIQDKGFGFLQKPYTLAELLVAVQETLQPPDTAQNDQ